MIKIYFFLISALFISVSLSAQSNTFPSSGNVGIGTGSPIQASLVLNGSNGGIDTFGQEFISTTDAQGANIGGQITLGGIWNSVTKTAFAGICGRKENGIEGDPNGYLAFATQNNHLVERMRIVSSGNVGIGTSTPDAKLAVNGAIHAKEVRVDLNVPGADYVFEKSYPLKALAKVNKYIAINHHLPDIPSAKSMEKNGIDISGMNMKLLQKVEELTLYLIKQNKQLQNQQKQIYDLNKKIRPVKYH